MAGGRPTRPMGGAPAAKRAPMITGRSKEARRQQALDAARGALAKRKKLSGHVLECLDRTRADSLPESWDRLFFELLNLDEDDLAASMARISKEMRQDLWTGIRGDGDMIAQITPMCAHFTRARDAAVGDLRHKLAAMSDSVPGSFRPGSEMRALVVNMARFGSMADDRMIRVIIDEVYIRNGHHDGVCDICEDILGFTGCDRHRMLSSTLVEGLVGAVLAELQRPMAFPTDGEFSPLMPDPGERLRPASLLARCRRILRSRAGSLGLDVPPGPGGDSLQRAMALALSLSGRKDMPGQAEIFAQVRQRHPRSYGFLLRGAIPPMVTGSAHIAPPAKGDPARLAPRSSPLAQSIISAMASRGQGHMRPVTHFRQNALWLLDLLLDGMDRAKAGADARTMKMWRAGLRGRRMWGCLLEMELYLRLRLAGASPSAVPAAAGAITALELYGCRVEAHSAMDGAARGDAARAGDPAARIAEGILGDARLVVEGNPKTVAIVDCPPWLCPDLGQLEGRLRAARALGHWQGALYLVQHDRGHYAHRLLKNPGPAAHIPNRALRLVARALRLDIRAVCRPGAPA